MPAPGEGKSFAYTAPGVPDPDGNDDPLAWSIESSPSPGQANPEKVPSVLLPTPEDCEEIVGAITGFSTSTDLWFESDRLMDFFDAKGIVEHIFRGLSGVLSFTKNDGTIYETGKKADIFLNEVLIGQIGELKSDLNEFYDLSSSPVVIFHLSLEAIQTVAQVQFVNYSEPSRYPSSFRDLALISSKKVDSESIVSTIMKNKLVADSFPIDKYEGAEVPDGKHSLTMRIIFQSNEKTLSAKEIDRAHIQIIKSLEHQYKISERYFSKER
jgi:phenylalanyl-tRNA synthetase beta chain